MFGDLTKASTTSLALFGDLVIKSGVSLAASARDIFPSNGPPPIQHGQAFSLYANT
jgi:hypothetical protein